MMPISTIHPGLVIAASVFALLAYGISVIIYNIWFHPLSRFPGPKKMAISSIIGHWRASLNMDMPHYVSALHRRYGPVVRIGPNWLAMEGSVGWSEVYGVRSTSDQNEFGKIPGFLFPNDHLALVGAKREDHRRQRRQLSHAFSAAALQEQEGIIVQYIDKFMSRLTVFAKQGEPFNIVSWLNYVAFDIIGDLTFADSFHGLDGNTTFVDNLFRGTLGNNYRRFLTQYPFLKPFLSLYLGSAELEKATIGAKENALLGRLKGQARMSMGAEPHDGRRDFATYMLRRSKNDTAVLSDEEISNISSALTVAGSETTAAAISASIFLTGMNTEKRKILVDEVRTAFTDESQITIASTVRLPYLHAIVEETLRIYPPSATLPPRVSPGAQLNGQWVPRGTILQTWPIATHHNPDNFIDADSFIPERWLSPQHHLYEARFAHDRRDLVKPFSYGSRDCIGKNLAYAEFRSILCRLVFRFDIELLPGQEQWMENQKAGTVWIRGPVMVRLKVQPSVIVE